MESDPRAVLRAYFDGINAERYDDVAALFACGGEIVAPGANPRGAAEIARYFAAALRPYPVHHDEPGAPAVAGVTVTVEVHFTGALVSGAPMEFDALDVFTLADGKIARLTTWHDSHAVRGRLAEAMARDGSPEARVLVALRLVSKGRAQRLEGRWRSGPPGLAARAVRIDLESASLTAGDLEAAGVRAGDVALVRSPDGLRVEDGVSGVAVAAQGAVTYAPDDVVVGENWALHALPAGWQGVLISQSGQGAVILS